MNASASVIERELSSEERLVWSGQPRGGIRLRALDVFLIPFSLLWRGFAIFWEITAITMISKAPGPVAVIFRLFGIPFVLLSGQTRICRE